MNSRINVNSAFCLGGFYRECNFTNGFFLCLRDVYYKFINNIVNFHGLYTRKNIPGDHEHYLRMLSINLYHIALCISSKPYLYTIYT